VSQGQAIFEGKFGCLKCHRVRGVGSRLGPDLTDTGNLQSPEELQKSLREPDAEVLPQNRFYRLVTRNGSVITGRLLNQDTFTVQLMDASERLLSFQKSTLREYGFVKNSPMPSYDGKLTPGELADLVAYLSSLKGVKPQ
jgi:putative heme-binding domain-containing protein